MQIFSIAQVKFSILTEEVWTDPDSKCSVNALHTCYATIASDASPVLKYITHLVYIHSELLVKIKLPESLQNAKTLCKLEKLMTTQRELVEELRLDSV